MGNPRGKPPRSDEAIAFAVVGQVLGITVEHADAGGGDGMVDGLWTYPDDRRAALEVTAGEASKEIGAERRAWRGGKPTDRNGSLSLDDLTGQLSKRLAEPWMEPNLAKLRAVRADETHLYLWGLGREDDFLYSTLAEALPSTEMQLPPGLTDLWLDAYVFRGEDTLRNVTVVRYNLAQGWSLHHAVYDEALLPAAR
ncbi:hypothetical protein [Micrococcus sp. TA1]|uniref:hypothetical protein n=1 Tax=Micrococcus sp. TA1 TaxID=681627 RepID=UPI00160EF715|nr:hypothetical protein [Micrococcus sp. TA1]MBB5750104.1 hypothetical protein [Micrococcus sp. TA1]